MSNARPSTISIPRHVGRYMGGGRDSLPAPTNRKPPNWETLSSSSGQNFSGSGPFGGSHSPPSPFLYAHCIVYARRAVVGAKGGKVVVGRLKETPTLPSIFPKSPLSCSASPLFLKAPSFKRRHVIYYHEENGPHDLSLKK